MALGERIAERMRVLALSQSELARRSAVSQATIAALATSRQHGSKHLHSIARALQTTTAYLLGETDDPDDMAPPPPAPPVVQYVMMPIAWPSELALEQMFAGLLEIAGYVDDAEARPTQAELARELAQQLPIGLSALQGPLVTRRNAPAARPRVLATDDHGPRR